MLKMVLRIDRARPGPFDGEDVMGCERFWQILGRNLSLLGDWRTRWMSRLYAAVNSGHHNMSAMALSRRTREPETVYLSRVRC